ncbi:MAG: SusD/RagB family nutrient-binding outer membrane lipoprotein [Flavobacteriaceae bacterium]
MKKIFKYLSIVLIGGTFVTSCETAELDLTDDPNALTPAQADPNFYLNEVQTKAAEVVEEFGEIGSEVTRIEQMASRNYQNAYSAASWDVEWEDAYQEVIKNARDMNVLAEEAGLTHHIAIGQVIEAYMITLLVDYFGDVPYSQAIGAPENLNPAPDAGADIYAAALALLDQAIANFNSTASAEPAIDFYYDGDWDKWIKAANTLKARLYINTGNISAFNAIIASGNYISDSADDFQFQWATNQVQPDTRHPYYGDTYTAQGIQNEYKSIWLMNMMDMSDDPRLRYYFFRQSETVPGADGTDPNEETLDCSLQTGPQHYISGGYPFCVLPNGFWGRNHGNQQGIPPDGFLRVGGGVYPIGGNFDDSRFGEIALGGGGGGAGITPYILSSWVEFWQAEVAMLGSPAAGKQFVLDGIATSIAKVQTFGSLDPEADLSTAPTMADVDAYIATVDADFDAADDEGKWNIMAEQFFIALYGNGHDAYNFYRRRGYPTDIEPNLEPDPGGFIRSFFYPANAANTNSGLTQKSGVSVQVFWDTNPASPGFPVGN